MNKNDVAEVLHERENRQKLYKYNQRKPQYEKFVKRRVLKYNWAITKCWHEISFNYNTVGTKKSFELLDDEEFHWYVKISKNKSAHRVLSPARSKYWIYRWEFIFTALSRFAKNQLKYTTSGSKPGLIAHYENYLCHIT